MNNSLIPPINPNTFNPKVINEETNKPLKQLFRDKSTAVAQFRLLRYIKTERGVEK